MSNRLFFFFTVFITGLNAQAQERQYTIYLLGDAGKLSPEQAELYTILESQMKETGANSMAIFLGDNIYPQGLPGENAFNRKEKEAVANAHIDLVKGFDGNKVFIPGNHDWAQGRKLGWTRLLNQEIYVENHLDSTDVFLPSGGCPGPVEFEISDEIVMLILDTQWFLHNWAKPDEEQAGCETADPVEVLQLLEGLIRKNRHKRIIVATHHPMYTYGSHGGYFPTKTHFIPPILGSIHPIYRKYIGSPQDITNPRNKTVRDAMVRIFEKYKNIVHVAGHEHSMQYSYKDSVHYVVSGSIAKTSFVRQTGFAQYAESAHGFGRLDFYDDGTVKLAFWKIGESGGIKTYEKELLKKPFVKPKSVEEISNTYDFEDSTVVTEASKQYQSGPFHQKLLGKNYREVWEEQIEVPVFDIGTEKGGLEIVQRGGGMQTKSLRLEAENGKQYVLRSIEKYPENAVPEILRNTFAVDLVQDQISAAHPYGAFVIPYLAEAIDIYHTNPKLVFIPYDVRFGEYKDDFAGTLALFEERPAKDWSDADFFGNSPDIENTMKVIEELREDNDNEVDQPFALRARLFDLLIGDWDRHDDQWRWAENEKECKGKIYQPIPRDRDQAFFVNEGVFPEIWSRKWALPKFEGFDYRVDWPSGLMFNARYFDRTFLTELSKEEWVAQAKHIQENLTDQVIEEAVKKGWPTSVYDLTGEEVIAKLKARREKLVDYAVDHYLFLTKTVDVLGSDKHEHFLVQRLPNGDVKVTVRKMKKDGEKKKVIYERTFKHKETKEIRLYGFAGQDEFEVEGDVDKSIKVRIIGGLDEDEIIDKSNVRGWSDKTVIYDTQDGNELELSKETKNKLSDDEAVNYYDRKDFKYDVLMPLITANFNPDDGIFLGGGFSYTKHGFRKDPFKSRHKLLGSYAFNTASYNLEYEGIYTDIVGKWDLQTDFRLRIPDFTNNFFGIGNETEFNQQIDETTNVDRAIDYYRLRFEEIAVNIGMFRELGPFGRVGVQANYYNWELEDLEGDDRFVDNLVSADPSLEENTFNYAGSTLHLEVDTRKDKNVPTAGIFWDNEINTFAGLTEGSGDFHQFNTSLSIYLSFRLPTRFTFASRVGYGANLGDYPFFVGQTLGGNEELRGYRKTRFYGDQRFYHNFEVRMKLASLKTYLFPASVGLLGFHDVGRVWVEGENSNKWHRGVGGGVWFTPFNMATLSAEVGHSEEETLFYVRLGFLF